MRHARCLPLLLGCLLAGCASVPEVPVNCIAIGPRGYICPLPPAALPTVNASHVVTVSRDEHKSTFLGRLQINRHVLRLAGASLFGTHLFTVTWDGKTTVARPPDSQLRPRLMVAMLQVALADPARLTPQLHGLVLQTSKHGANEVRKLFEHGHLVARIERHGATLASSRLDISVPSAKLELHLEPMTETP